MCTLEGAHKEGAIGVVIGSIAGTIFLVGSAPGVMFGLGLVAARMGVETLHERGALDLFDWVSLSLRAWLVALAAVGLWLAPGDLHHPLPVLALGLGLAHFGYGLQRPAPDQAPGWLRRVLDGHEPRFAVVTLERIDRDLYRDTEDVPIAQIRLGTGDGVE